MTGVHLEHDWFPEALPANVRFGAGTWIYSSFAFRHYQSVLGVRIGRNTGVYNGTFFELGPAGEVVIGDYCTVVGAIFATNGRVEIHDYAFLAHEVVVADAPAAVPPIVSRSGPAAPPSPTIVIGEDAWVGARAVILAGARLGRGCVVGASTTVDFDVPDYGVVAGSPARTVGWARPPSASG